MTSPSVSAILMELPLHARNSQEQSRLKRSSDCGIGNPKRVCPAHLLGRAQSAIIRLAVDVKLFQYLKDAGDAGLTPTAFSQKTQVDSIILKRLTRHLVAMNLVSFQNGMFYATKLSNGLAEENYQHSINFCYDVSRPLMNSFPGYFKKSEYNSPTLGGTDGPFQDAHKTNLAFFEWLVATPPHLQLFNSFMSAYRAGKPDWHEFYPVTE
ncbi:unnamed protein product [Penicillium glandicola]